MAGPRWDKKDVVYGIARLECTHTQYMNMIPKENTTVISFLLELVEKYVNPVFIVLAVETPKFSTI